MHLHRFFCFSLQHPCDSGDQQHSDSGGSKEERFPTEPGETALQELRHETTELVATAHTSHERIETIGPQMHLRGRDNELPDAAPCEGP